MLLMPTLGSSSEYEVFIVDSFDQRTSHVVPWSKIGWQRVRCKVSSGSIVIPGADGGLNCCAVFGGLRPYSQMIRIERNGAPVWDGPIVGWGRPALGQGQPGDVEIRALDRSVLTQKRLVGADRVGTYPAGETMLALLQGADIGDPLADPWLMTLPSSAPAYLSTFTREYRIARLERVFDCLDELCRNVGAFFTQFLDQLILDEQTVIDAMGGTSVRPRLTDRTVVETPAIDFDGLEMVSVAYAGGSTEGESGFPLIGSSNFWTGEYLSGRLELGYADSRSKTLPNLNAVALLKATENATGRLAVEQVELTEHFGSRRTKRDLSNLLPGIRLDVDFQDTCAFDVPFIDVRYESRTIISGGVPMTGPVLTPVIAATITMMRLDQLDVTVEATGNGVVERVLASCSPTAEWDGTLPPGWFDPSIEDET